MFDELTDELYRNFVEEIKLLHMINHQNIVRVFNYYLYPEEKTGYILMEFISGFDIEDYLRRFPEDVNSIFCSGQQKPDKKLSAFFKFNRAFVIQG